MTNHLPAHTRRLAQLVMRPGGLTAAEAVRAAEQNVATLQDRGLSEIATTIGRMQAIGSALVEGADETLRAELYTLGNGLIGIAGVFGKSALGGIALSLCTLIDRQQLAGQWDAEAIRLHLESLRLLSGTTVSEAEVATIENALRQVVDRVRPTVPSSPVT